MAVVTLRSDGPYCKRPQPTGLIKKEQYWQVCAVRMYTVRCTRARVRVCVCVCVCGGINFCSWSHLYIHQLSRTTLRSPISCTTHSGLIYVYCNADYYCRQTSKQHRQRFTALVYNHFLPLVQTHQQWLQEVPLPLLLVSV